MIITSLFFIAFDRNSVPDTILPFLFTCINRLDSIDKLSLSKNQYDNFAYHTALLNDFVRNQATKIDGGLTSSAHFVRGRNAFGGSIHQMTGSNASSVNSSNSSRRGSIGSKKVFKSMSKKMATASTMKRSVSTSAF